jgi:hypothetical protein
MLEHPKAQYTNKVKIIDMQTMDNQQEIKITQIGSFL